jgi:hypothetical protein
MMEVSGHFNTGVVLDDPGEEEKLISRMLPRMTIWKFS